jgi:hypothetical protein
MVFLSESDVISGISPRMYLQTAKKYAISHGYNPNLLTFSTKPKYKLSYDNINFGSAINNDYILYKSLELHGLANEGEAEKHRTNYLKRSSAIKGNWRNNPKSRNNLSMKILWNK